MYTLHLAVASFPVGCAAPFEVEAACCSGVCCTWPTFKTRTHVQMLKAGKCYSTHRRMQMLHGPQHACNACICKAWTFAGGWSQEYVCLTACSAYASDTLNACAAKTAAVAPAKAKACSRVFPREEDPAEVWLAQSYPQPISVGCWHMAGPLPRVCFLAPVPAETPC